MADKPEHLPTPFTVHGKPGGEQYVYDAEGHLVATTNGPSRADFIVTACNSHEQLVEACKVVLSGHDTRERRAIDMVRDALAAARHGEGHAVAGAEGGAS